MNIPHRELKSAQTTGVTNIRTLMEGARGNRILMTKAASRAAGICRVRFIKILLLYIVRSSMGMDFSIHRFFPSSDSEMQVVQLMDIRAPTAKGMILPAISAILGIPVN